MPEHKNNTRLYPPDIIKMKQTGEKILLACPWDYHSTLMAEQAGADIIGFGGGTHQMMLGGRQNALGASMDDILSLTATIVPATRRCLVNIALPYGSFHQSPEQAIGNAVKLIKAGAQSVKAQIDDGMLDRAEAIVNAGVPFQGHVGLMPQYINRDGGLKVCGRTAEQAKQLFALCKRLESLGAWSIEMECVPYKIAAEISKRLSIPVLGIGSGPYTDGQIVVLVDLLGLQQTLELKFVKKYADLWPIALEAVTANIKDIKTGKFPERQHCFNIKDDEFNQFMEWVAD